MADLTLDGAGELVRQSKQIKGQMSQQANANSTDASYLATSEKWAGHVPLLPVITQEKGGGKEISTAKERDAPGVVRFTPSTLCVQPEMHSAERAKRQDTSQLFVDLLK